jgi:sugar lactone lactonase YvrE
LNKLEEDKSVENYLRRRNPEARLLIRIFAIIGFVVMLLLLAGFVFIKVKVPQLLEFSKGISEYRIKVKPDSLEGYRFIKGMTGCENICLLNDNSGFYVSSLDGTITYVDGEPGGTLSISKSFRAGSAVFGMSLDKEGHLYVAACTGRMQDWQSIGAAVYRVSEGLDGMERVSADFPAMNGICIDKDGNLYFTTSNFKYLNPKGDIYRMAYLADGKYGQPGLFITGIGLANGLYYDALQDKIYFSNTIGGCYSFSPGVPEFKAEYLKTWFMEACDDLCTDTGGNIWMADPGNSTVKMYNPGTNRLIRFSIEGIGQSSSCRIRTENGVEMLYITELKQSDLVKSTKFDGRGVLIVPAQSLIRLIEPLLIKNNPGS